VLEIGLPCKLAFIYRVRPITLH